MKVLFEWGNKNFIMEPEQASEIIQLIHRYSKEVFEHKRNWKDKTETDHVYSITPAELGVLPMQFITDELYGLGKIMGRPED